MVLRSLLTQEELQLLFGVIREDMAAACNSDIAAAHPLGCFAATK